MADLDAIDTRIIGQLRNNARISNADLAQAVGLSPSACHRRVKQLEARGIIRGYTVVLDARQAKRGTVVFVQITLDRQTDDVLARFEQAARRCPEIRECYLMTGDSDYFLRVEAESAQDFERIHKEILSSLPGVSRIHSSFSIRNVLSAKKPR